MAGNVIPGPVVCLLLSGGLVVDVGEVTVHVVNLDAVVVGVLVDVATVIDAVVVAVASGDATAVFDSDMLEVAVDF